MYSIIVVPPPTTEGSGRPAQIRLAPGEGISFGRSACNDVTIVHEGVSRRAGEIRAQGAYWILSNLCAHQTYVVGEPGGRRGAHQGGAGPAGGARAVRVLPDRAARRG
ncbi:hypothetical protein GCM10020256_28730 [Streptomyces thermocoprophilus]